jgi:hypothetical protein
MLSAATDQELEHIQVDILKKPFGIEELLDAIDQVIRRDHLKLAFAN